jgi:hypothetical protein
LDVDLVTLLTGYIFFSFGQIQAAAFALGQGLLIDVFSSGPSGFSGLLYMGVFWAIYLGSLFFNLETPKGQMIVISLTVLLKNAAWQCLFAILFGKFMISASFLYAAIVAVVGTGLLAPLLYAVFDRLRGIPPGGEDAPELDDVTDRHLIKDYY